MEIALQRAHRNLGIAETPKCGVHGGPARRIVGHVAHQRRVGPGSLRLVAQQLEDDPAAALLLSLEDEMHVEGRQPLGIEHRFIGLEQAEHLPLVIGGPAGVELAVPHRGRERLGDPLVERVGGLDVVVAVDQECRPVRNPGTLRPDHRVARSLDDVHHRTAQAAQVGAQPLGGPPAIPGRAPGAR